MTQDPLLALGVRWKKKKKNERENVGEGKKKDERDLSGNDCSQGNESRL